MMENENHKLQFPEISEMHQEDFQKLMSEKTSNQEPVKAPEEILFFEDEPTPCQDISTSDEGNDITIEKDPYEKIPDFIGLFGNNKKKSAAQRGAMSVLLSIALALLMILAGTIAAALYLFVISVIALGALILLVASIALIVIGISGLCNGIVSIFTEGWLIAVAEIGLCLVVSALIIVFCAYSGELIFGQLPKLIHKLTDCIRFVFRYILCFAFGKEKMISRSRKEAKQHA